MTLSSTCKRTEDDLAVRYLCTEPAHEQSTPANWAVGFTLPEPDLFTGTNSFEARINGKEDYNLDFNGLTILPPPNTYGNWHYSFLLVDRNLVPHPKDTPVMVQCEFVYNK